MVNKLKRFVRKVKRDKRYQAGLLILLAIMLVISGRIHQANIDREKFEIQKTEIIAEYETQIEELKAQHEADIISIRWEYEQQAPEEMYKVEAEYIAKVLYGTARNNSERDQRTTVWCILNRVDHHGYPNTVEGVCTQASQWMGYSDENPILSNVS